MRSQFVPGGVVIWGSYFDFPLNVHLCNVGWIFL